MFKNTQCPSPASLAGHPRIRWKGNVKPLAALESAKPHRFAKQYSQVRPTYLDSNDRLLSQPHPGMCTAELLIEKSQENYPMHRIISARHFKIHSIMSIRPTSCLNLSFRVFFLMCFLILTSCWTGSLLRSFTTIGEAVPNNAAPMRYFIYSRSVF